MRKIIFNIVFLLVSNAIFGQNEGKVAFGFNYGFGSEFRNRNYTFSNHFYKGQFYFTIKQSNHFMFQILVQPEVNFGSHQLLNFYFVKPEEPNYIEKREEYTKQKDVNEYVLNLGFIIRKPIGDRTSLYFLGSVGPLIIDTETERMSKGFAFADVAAVGFSFSIHKAVFLDVRPSIRHVSNAGLASKNSGYNTKNIEFGFAYKP